METKKNEYFTIQELCASKVAILQKIDNLPPPEVKVKLRTLIQNVLNPVREIWGKAILVNSGFRSPILNKAIGGAVNSQHIKGEAADITTGSKEGNKKLFDMIIASEINFDQLIDESKYSWLHISYSNKNRKQILHL
jgi:hypothetical protein